MTTALAQTTADLIGALERYRGQLVRELAACDVALGALTGLTEAPPEAKPARTSKAPAKTTTAATPEPKPKRAAPAAPARKLAPDEARVAMGRLPWRAGVGSLACDSSEERIAKVAELKAQGLRRITGLERLTPGTFDVRSTPDGDVVIWILNEN